ncbi:MAG: PHP domain-containing protein [Thermodesulfobacteriota bacterium]|nr:PHP domain-containing protein [Thermodesulfobacteriota bacterium]
MTLAINADLHLHTTASDGDLTPEKIVSLAESRGIKTLAITDHDTLSGLSEACAAPGNIRVINGLEISAQCTPGTMHLLGYFPEYPRGMEGDLSGVQAGRKKRLPLIISKLKDLGMDIEASEVAEIAGRAQTGRPHIAKVLVAKGYVRDMNEAFSRYLAKSRPAYVEKEEMTRTRAIEMIRAYGGISVLAHPFTLGLEDHELNALVKELAGQGLQGIEVYYPEHTRAQKRLYLEIAKDLDLIATGGTDFHSFKRKKIYPGAFGVNNDTIDAMEKRWEMLRP